MEHDFGKQLIQARLARGLTVEEAAYGTRMRPGMVRALEDSNLTQFPNAAYAKSFLLMYAKYLGVDMSGVAGSIDTSTQMRVADFQYLTSLASEEKKQQKEASSDSRYDFVVARKPGGSWWPLFVVLGVGAIGLVVFMVINNLHRFDTSKPTPAPQAAVHPTTPVPPTTPPASGTPHVKPATPEPGTDAHPTVAVTPAAPGDAHEGGTTPSPAVPVVPVVPAPINNAPGVVVDTHSTPEETTNGPVLPPGTVVLEPTRKTWVVIRTGPGGQPLYEDFLYPTAKPMHLPAGKYFIELRDAEAVEISKDGKSIAYSAPGVLVD